MALAEAGAKLIVNDLGASADGEGEDTSPAKEVVQEITALGGEAAFQAALIDGDLSGFDNLEDVLDGAGQGTLEDHLARWAAMLYMDGRPGASAENSMSSWDLFSASQVIVETAWLHPVEYGFADFSETVTVRDPSTAYFLVGGPGMSSFTLRVGTPSGSDLASDVQVWLVRTQ